MSILHDFVFALMGRGSHWSDADRQRPTIDYLEHGRTRERVGRLEVRVNELATRTAALEALRASARLQGRGDDQND